MIVTVRAVLVAALVATVGFALLPQASAHHPVHCGDDGDHRVYVGPYVSGLDPTDPDTWTQRIIRQGFTCCLQQEADYRPWDPLCTVWLVGDVGGLDEAPIESPLG